MPVATKVNVKNLRRLAWQAGFEGVTGLARHVRRTRTTVWRAVREPHRFSPTYKKVIEALHG